MSASPRYGILIANTGTPDAPEPAAITAFLRQMLMDPAVVSCPHFIWKPVLERFILPNRPQRTITRYERIWTDEGSPFLLDSRKQQQALQDVLTAQGREVPVALGMRYGNPSFADALSQLEQRGCTHVAFLPLYPQQAKSTTGTHIHAFKAAVRETPNLTGGPIIDGFYDDEAYLDALARSVERVWSYKPGSRLLLSYHSVPIADIKAGDPYHRQTLDTAAAVAKRLGIDKADWACAYHSRFDSRRWLKPSAEEVLEKWAAEGVRDVAVVAPVFTTDCIETLVDIDIEQRAFFAQCCTECGDAGTVNFTYVPCLGAEPAFIDALAGILNRRLP